VAAGRSRKPEPQAEVTWSGGWRKRSSMRTIEFRVARRAQIPRITERSGLHTALPRARPSEQWCTFTTEEQDKYASFAKKLAPITGTPARVCQVANT